MPQELSLSSDTSAADSTVELISCRGCGHPTTALFCEFCSEGGTCYQCPSSDVYLDNRKVHCSHGCEYPATEHIQQHNLTTIYNSGPLETLTRAGKRVELLLPEEADITVRPVSDRFETPPDGRIFTTHYTDSPDRLLSEGVYYPLGDWHGSEGDERRHPDSIRNNCLFAWPYTPAAAEAVIGSEFEHEQAVIFEVSADAVRVSSYGFLEMLLFDQTTTERYHTDLMFSISQLREACSKFQRPLTPAQLFF